MKDLKAAVAQAAIEWIKPHSIIGVGTGSTMQYFIEKLAECKGDLEACVPSSQATEQALKKWGLPVLDLNQISELPIYIDSADRVNSLKQLIKGAGGAATREKILASMAEQFICIIDHSKWVKVFDDFPIAVEVLPIARSYVGREIIKMGGEPTYRQGFITDNGNIILDVILEKIDQPIQWEERLNALPGVVDSGLFAKRAADQVIVASERGIELFR
jgi:ribose 5-phosphate isomerase A